MDTIEKVSLTDTIAADLLAMSARWESEDSCFGYRANTEADLQGQDIFLARQDGAAIGYLLCHPYVQEEKSCTISLGSRCLEIEELYVLPEHRSKGIGKQLYQAAVDSCGGALDFVTLSTATKNYKAILHFYIDRLEMTFWNARLFQKLSKETDGAAQ